MIISKTKRWGNSLGVIIPKEEVQHLHLKEDEPVVIEIIKAGNPLKELFGFGKEDKISKKEFLETRALLESTRL